MWCVRVRGSLQHAGVIKGAPLIGTPEGAWVGCTQVSPGGSHARCGGASLCSPHQQNVTREGMPCPCRWVISQRPRPDLLGEPVNCSLPVREVSSPEGWLSMRATMEPPSEAAATGNRTRGTTVSLAAHHSSVRLATSAELPAPFQLEC